MTETFLCAHCGRLHPISARHEMDGSDLCPDCLEEQTVICSHCGQRIWASDNAGDGSRSLCQDCCDAYYLYCAQCGCLLSIDEAYIDDDNDYVCADCYHRAQNSHAIHNYAYKPSPIFYGTGDRYFGVELEIDRGGEDSDTARTLLSIANAEEELLYCKHDGSLEDGFELVTHPLTFQYHLESMPWRKVLQKAVSLGYCSHKGGTCGLHIHINCSAFGESEDEQEPVIARILYFVEKHWEELLKFSRRTPRQLERWASRYGYKDRPKDILDHAKKGYGGRYSSVNLENRATIEFRIFRGTLKFNTLTATLQLVNRICDVPLSLSDEELQAMSWTTFVSGCQEKELIQYLKERRLYVNEPITTEEEI